MVEGRGEFKREKSFRLEGNCCACRNASRKGSGTVEYGIINLPYQQKGFDAQWPGRQEPPVSLPLFVEPFFYIRMFLR